MEYEKNVWHNPLMNRIENALELAFKEIEVLKTEIDTLKEGNVEKKTTKTVKTTKK